MFYSQKRKSKDKGDWLYFHPECKECTKKRSRKWQIDNEERWKEIYTYANNNPSEELLTLKKYHSNNRREGYRKEYYDKNKDKWYVYGLDKRENRTHIINDDEWLACKLYFNNCCAYCNISLSDHYDKHNQDLHKEHVDHEGKNDLSNCIPSCKNCNSQKWMFSLEDWYSVNNENYIIERLEKILNWLNVDYKNHIQNYDLIT